MDSNPLILGRTEIHSSVTISPFSIIGFEGDLSEVRDQHAARTTKIKKDVWIGPYVTLYRGAVIEEGVKIDPYCRIGHNSVIGNKSRILYGSRIHDDVSIGENCIIGGNCSNRVHIGNKVVHFGRITHKFNDPHADWNETEEPSLRIGDGSVIGAQALLVGDIAIGKHVYVAAGEIVRESIPDCCIVYKGKIHNRREWTGSLIGSKFWDECP